MAQTSYKWKVILVNGTTYDVACTSADIPNTIDFNESIAAIISYDWEP